MQTLSQWQNENNVLVIRHGHSRTVHTSSPNLADLFQLEDYVVLGQCGDVLWLFRRHPFNYDERFKRMNIRNLCVGHTIHELEMLSLDCEGFKRDCIDEFMLELEYESR